MNTSATYMIRFIAAVMLCMTSFAVAQTPVSLYNSFSGPVNYTVIGGSLRDSGNTLSSRSAMSYRATDTSKLMYPSGATIIGAYLYWAGSGASADNNVTLNGNSYSASRTFSESYLNGSLWLYFFGGFADVTSYVASAGNNLTYTFGGLTVDTSYNYQQSQAAVAGWALVVVYYKESEVKKAVNIFDGFEIFRGEQITFTPNNFYVPYSLVEGKMTHITFEGDKENSTSLSGYTEQVLFNGTPLTDAYNPVANQFGSRSNAFPEDSTFGVDIDTYDITSLLSPADTQAVSVYSSGGDLVILNVEVISIADTSNSDIRVIKTHSGGSMVAGDYVTYTLSVSNYGPDTTGTITLVDSLRSGLTFISSTFGAGGDYGTGWTIDSTQRPKYVWTHTGVHPDSTNLPPVTITAYLTAENYPTQYNSAYASSPQFDRKPWNNSSTDSLTILSPIFLTSTKSYSDLNGGSVRPGDTLVYTINVSNSGNYPATNVSVIDSMPTGMAVVPGSFSPAATYTGTSSTGQVVTFNNYAGPLNVSGSTSFSFRVVLDSTLLGGSTVTNVARVRASTIDQRITSSFVPVNAPPMDIQKGRYGGGAGSGDTVRYYMVVTNTSGYATSTGTQVIDTIPEPTGTTANNPYYISGSATPSAVVTQGPNVGDRDTIITWTVGTLAPGESDTVEFKVRISSGLANGNTITNKGTVINTQGSRDSSNFSFIKQAPVVTISKFLYPPGSGTGDGDTVLYYIVISNTDPYAYSFDTRVYDTIPVPISINTNNSRTRNPYLLNTTIQPTATSLTQVAAPSGGTRDADSVIYWNIGTLGPNEIDTLKFKMRISSTLNNNTNVTNKATVTNAQGRRDSSSFTYRKTVFYTAKLFGTQYILPGDSIYFNLWEADTNKNVSVIESITLIDTNRVTSERENITMTETGANTGEFTGKIATTYGASAGTNNTGVFNVKPGDSLRISYVDRNDSTGTGVVSRWKYWVTKVLNGHAVALSGTDSILPTQTIYYTVNDSDLNRSSTVIETYTILDSNQVTGEIENLLFTETGINTGIFTSSIVTVFGTTSNGNNNGTFAVQKGDTITLKYYDSVIVNGSNGGLKTWKTYVRGGQTAVLSSTSPINPSNSILVSITDSDLNLSASIIDSIQVQDSSVTTGEVEYFYVTETGINTGVFTKTLSTIYGPSAGTNNDGSFTVKAGDSLRVTYYDTLLTNGGPGGVKTVGTLVIGGANALLTATTPITPTDSLLITVTDADLNKNALVIESYSIRDSSISTNEVETFTVTETGVNTGIFTKWLRTVFGVTAGTNNDGIFNVKAGDSLRVTYRDSLRLIGSDSTLHAFTRVLGGTTAALSADSLIYPADSILITVTDADLNLSATVIESYTIRDSSINTNEVETFTVTETGVNTGIFTKWMQTIFGLTAGTNNDGVFNVKAGDTLRVTYIDSLRLNGSDSTLRAQTRVRGGVTATVSSSTPINPWDSLLITVTDADLNRSASIAESYTVRDTNIVTGEVETFTVTETGVNTGIFTKWIRTVFGVTAGTNNDGIYNVKAGDTLRVTYRDTLMTNGGSQWISAVTVVLGGVTATIGSNPAVIAANDTSLFTLTDNDLNSNAATIQSYVLSLYSRTGETETKTFTETGVNTGIFTALVPTIYGSTPGPNANGIFTVQPGDTITVLYHDSLRVLGDTATINAIFRIGTVTFSASSKSYVDGNGGFVKPPDTLQYSVKVKNTGTVAATNVALVDTLPNHVTILAGTISNSGSNSGQVITWPVFTLAAGDSATYQYQVRIDSSIVSQVPYVNKATIDGNGIRTQVTATFTPVNRPLMTMTKTVSNGRSRPGDTLTYTIAYSNIGTVPAALVTMTDVQPDNTTYVPNSTTINSVAKTDAADADEVTLTGVTVQLNIGLIAPGASGTVTLKVRIN